MMVSASKVIRWVSAIFATLASVGLFAQTPNSVGQSTENKDQSTQFVSASDAQKNKPATTIEKDYKIGSQDLMEIAVFGQPDLTRTVRVNSAGEISLPLIGTMLATGLTAQQLEQKIAGLLGEKYLQNPQVSVFMKEFTTLRFTVEGAVNKPGVYPLTGQMTLLRALAVAGGQGQLSDLSEVMLFRVTEKGERQTLKFDAEKIRGGDAQDPLLQNDDLLVVKRSRARTALKDSLFRDILDAINPIPLLK
ncbi:MAG: polysaccharide biosynthesis/export family protein [Casimicrobium sp.]